MTELIHHDYGPVGEFCHGCEPVSIVARPHGRGRARHGRLRGRPARRLADAGDPHGRGLPRPVRRQPRVVWVGGTKGTFGRTADGGTTWSAGTVPGGEARLPRCRGVRGRDRVPAQCRPRADSRIYKTTDAGKTWALQFKNADPEAFYDALAFWDEKTGMALGDPVKGRFQLLATDDGGATWKSLDPKTLPPPCPTRGRSRRADLPRDAREGRRLVLYGRAKAARVFHSADRGRTWAVAEAPIPAGVARPAPSRSPSATGTTGWSWAGTTDAERRRRDRGRHRRRRQDVDPAATVMPFRSGVAWAKDRWVAVGTAGSHASRDGRRGNRSTGRTPTPCRPPPPARPGPSARRAGSRRSGVRIVPDGPFAGGREVVGGFFLLDGVTKEEASASPTSARPPRGRRSRCGKWGRAKRSIGATGPPSPLRHPGLGVEEQVPFQFLGRDRVALVGDTEE